MDLQLLAAFAGAFFVFAASPGPDNMTIVARTLTHGPSSGFAYGAGMVLGILIYLALAACGLSLIAREMSWLMTAMRYIGGLYLLWMAFSLWRAPIATGEGELRSGTPDIIRTFLTGMALNLGNPKMPLFYLALLPNFVHADFGIGEFAAMGLAIILVEIVVIGTHVWLAGKGRRLLRAPAFVRKVNRAAAVFLCGTGLAVMATQSPR